MLCKGDGVDVVVDALTAVEYGEWGGWGGNWGSDLIRDGVTKTVTCC